MARKDRHYAYLAGLIDGEGNIGVYRCKNQKGYWGYSINLSVSNKDKRLMNYLIKHFGGSFKPGTRSFNWEPHGGKERIKSLLLSVLDSLIIKKEQAKLCLSFIDLGNKIIPDIRENFYFKSKILNSGSSKSIGLMHNTKSDFSYLAALIDGEGSLRIIKTKQYNANGYCYHKVINITNCSRALMEYLVLHFGGIFKPKHSANENYIPAFRWTIFGNEIQENLLLAILPYLILKKQEANLILQFIRLDSKVNQEAREDLYQQFQKLYQPLSPETNTPETSLEVKIESELHGNM
jgi:hypothetical protein